MKSKPTPRSARPRPASSEPLPLDSLARSLQLAAAVVADVLSGSALPSALARRSTDVANRGAVQDLSYRCLRWRGSSDGVLRLMLQHPPQSERLHALLNCALALLLDPARPYEDYAVVDQTVQACASDRSTEHARGMVNAVLRRFLRERESLLERAFEDEGARWNHPRWWVEAMRKAYPDAWRAVLEVAQHEPPLTLRVNLRKISVERYLEALREAGMEGLRLGPQAVRVLQPVPVNRLPGFEQGWVSVQDAAAQWAAPLLDLADGQRVLDACAAPGGKTGHLLELANVELTALDVDAERLERVSQNLKRLQLDAQLQVGDATGRDWWDGKAYDRILADLPCTASGIVRRHPDVRWLRRPEDAAKLARTSAAILDNLWSLLAPGGLLLMVTCSIWPEESEEQAVAFERRHAALRLPASGQALPCMEAENDHDGLFHALFRKPA